MSEEVKNASTVRSIRASGDVFEKLKEIAAQGNWRPRKPPRTR